MLKFEADVARVICDVEGRLLVAVSGGADSTALLHCLCRLKRDCVVAHCNFHLRGAESDRDQSFVEELCRQHGVSFNVIDFDVEEYCRNHKVSVEMACRELRYEWFASLLEKHGCTRIVVAHNSDDNIETMLLNLFRGTGIDGLVGMKVDNGKILRPLLQFTRKDIEEYLNDEGIGYVVDSTNLQSDYRRNYIRNVLLPELETRWTGIRKTLRRSQINLCGVETFYKSKLSELLAETDENFLSYDIIRKSPDKTTLLYEYFKNHGINDSIIKEMSVALAADDFVGKRWLLTDCEVVAERDGFHVLKDNEGQSFTIDYTCDELQMNEELARGIRGNKDQTVIYLPKSIENYRFRHPQIGDRISPLGMRGSSLVSDILKDAKLTTKQRRNYWLLEEISTGEIIWLPGIKRSRHSLVDFSASEVYKVVYN